MSDARFNETLDAMVRGEAPPQDPDELERFAQSIYDEEGRTVMPTLSKTAIARQLGLQQPALTTPVGVYMAPAADTRSPARRPSMWAVMLSIAAVAALLIASVWQLGLLNRNGNDESPSYLASAVPTVNASPDSPVDNEAWLTTINDCPSPSKQAEAPAEAPEMGTRTSLPVGPAAPEDAEAVAEQARNYYGCLAENKPATFATDYMRWNELSTQFPMSVYSPELIRTTITRSQQITAWYNESGTDLTQFNPGVARSEVPSLPADGDRYAAFNPDTAVAMDDGRVGIPSYVSFVTESGDAPRSSNQNLALAFMVFDHDGEQWLADELLYICLSQCDQYFPYLQDYLLTSAWMQPVDTSECTNLDVTAGDSPGDSESLAYRSRQYVACEGSDDAAPLQAPGFSPAERTNVKLLSDEIARAYTAGGNTPSALQRTIAPTTFTSDAVPAGEYVFYDPSLAIALSDGRMATIEIQAIHDPNSQTVSIRTNPVVTRALVWAEHDDAWLVEEIVPLCFGGCDEFWDQSDATPAASPAVQGWLTPIAPAECPQDETTPVGPNDPEQTWTEEEYRQEFPDREYQPFGEPSREDSEAVATRWRQSNACSFSANSQLQIMGPRYYYEQRTTDGRAEFEGSGQAAIQREEGEALSAWLQTERGLTIDDILIPGIDTDRVGFRTVADPDLMVQLPDGRIAMVPVQLLTKSQEEAIAAYEGERYAAPYVVIWAEYDGQWYLDETFQICIGECDGFWQQQAGTPVASPVVGVPAGMPGSDHQDMAPAGNTEQSTATEVIEIEAIEPSPTP